MRNLTTLHAEVLLLGEKYVKGEIGRKEWTAAVAAIHSEMSELKSACFPCTCLACRANAGNPAEEAASKVASDQPLPCPACYGKGQTEGWRTGTRSLCFTCNGTGIAK